jgi:hypothetical protein
MRVVPESEGAKFAANEGIFIFRETSAVTNENIVEIFEDMARGIVDHTTLTPRSRRIVGATAPRQQQGCCG